jgi:hypothetical protein
VRRFQTSDAAGWDAFVATSATGNLLHTRRFLDYHRDRFEDRSLIFTAEGGRIAAVLPAALDPADSGRVVSHPGATYGGLLVPAERAAEVPALLEAALVHYRAEGIGRLLYRCVPALLHASASGVDGWALWRAGARLARRDLWSFLELPHGFAPTEERRRHLRRARDAGLRIARDDSDAAYEAFHAVLRDCLADRHEAAPVHSLAEMRELRDRFPDRIALWLATDAAGSCLAGEWIFDLGQAWHGQYGAASANGRRASAQDLLLEDIIQAASQAGRRAFSFGTSTEQAGRHLNTGLFRYKASFGAGNAVHDFLEIDTGPRGPVEPQSQ